MWTGSDPGKTLDNLITYCSAAHHLTFVVFIQVIDVSTLTPFVKEINNKKIFFYLLFCVFC